MTVWDSAPPSDQPANVYFVPLLPCGEVVAMVCCDPNCQFTLTGATCNVPPSTLTCRPAGTVLIVMLELFTAKLAVTVCGEFMVMEVEAELELATLPVQPVNL